MAVAHELMELASRLGARTPLVGARTRRRACEKLAELKSSEAVPFLVSALSDPDEAVRQAAEVGLKQLTDATALDAMAIGHVLTRCEVLRDILAERGHAAPDALELAAEAPPSAEAVWRFENPTDGTELAFIPEGDFQAGQAGFTAHLPGYWLALAAVSNEQYCRFLRESRPDAGRLASWIRLGQDVAIRSDGTSYVTSPETADLPADTVTWDGAVGYCRWAGLRLPSELEWEKGARGVDGRQFPWGDEWASGRPRPPEGERQAEVAHSVRAFPTARSPYGLYQMIGGPFEWCEDWFEEGAYERYASGDMRQPAGGEHHVLRGGPWTFGTPVYMRTEFRKGTAWRAGTLRCGFRCARSL